MPDLLAAAPLPATAALVAVLDAGGIIIATATTWRDADAVLADLPGTADEVADAATACLTGTTDDLSARVVRLNLAAPGARIAGGTNGAADVVRTVTALVIGGATRVDLRMVQRRTAESLATWPALLTVMTTIAATGLSVHALLARLLDDAGVVTLLHTLPAPAAALGLGIRRPREARNDSRCSCCDSCE